MSSERLCPVITPGWLSFVTMFTVAFVVRASVGRSFSPRSIRS